MSRKFELPISLDELKSEYEDGLNTADLSKKYGCSEVTIGKLLDSVGCDKNCLCNDSICEFVLLCISCHSKTNNDREYWETQITERIETLK